MLKQSRFLKIAVLCLSVAVGGGIAYYLSKSSGKATTAAVQQEVISDYNEQRDAEDILKLFEEDWYWLSTRDFSRERLLWQLNSGSPNEYEHRYIGKMRVSVLREDGKFVGFTTYYMKNFHEGIILFLAIRPEFRGKRYGQRLLDYGIEQLKQMGAKEVSLVTRVNNQSGIKLYNRAGFAQSRDDDDFFAFRKKV